MNQLKGRLSKYLISFYHRRFCRTLRANDCKKLKLILSQPKNYDDNKTIGVYIKIAEIPSNSSSYEIDHLTEQIKEDFEKETQGENNKCLNK